MDSNAALAEIKDYLEGAREYDHYLVALCPFHDDSRPSFFVYPDNYKCLSCGAFGRTENLLTKLSGRPIKNAPAKHWSNPFTGWLKDESLAKCLWIAHVYLVEHPSEYLRRRGIPDKYQIKARLGLRDDFYLFPIRNQKQDIIGAVARKSEHSTMDSKYIIPHGQNPNLLYVPNWTLINKSMAVYLTFGILDALTLAILGRAAMSTTTGKQIDPSALDWCRKRIIIVPDKGEEADGMKLSARLDWRGSVLKLDWPDGCKDINNLLVYQPDFLKAILCRSIGAEQVKL